MRISAPSESIEFSTTDIHGNSLRLSDFRGSAVVLSFFSDASCPFCIKRVFELRARRKQWKRMGVEILTIFNSTEEQIKNFKNNQPIHLSAIADPDMEICALYRVEHSLPSSFKTLFSKIPTIVIGFLNGSKVTNDPNPMIMPADFLIDDEGMIVDLKYGENASDHMPIKRIEGFVRAAAKKARLIELTREAD